MMELKKELVCIRCPAGCNIMVYKETEEVKIQNYKCDKGREYAVSEIVNPVRYVTTTIMINGDQSNRLAVKTDIPVQKEKIFDVITEIKALKVNSPIFIGQVLIYKVAGTAADIVAASEVL